MKTYALRVQQKGPRALTTVIDRLHSLPLQDRFIGQLGLRLEDKGTRDGFLIMEFARARSGHGPGRMRRDTAMREFRLDEGESFAEDTTIAYCPDTHYCALMYNHIGPRPILIERYLRAVDESFGGLRAKRANEHDEDVAGFVFGTVLRRDAAARMRRLGIFREVEFTISDPGVVREDIAQGRSLGSVLNAPLPDGIATLTMRMKATPHDRNGSLGAGRVRGMIDDLRRLGHNLRGASVRGKASSGDRVETIDLVEDALFRKGDLPIGRGGRYSKNDRWRYAAETLRGWIENGDVIVRR